MKKCKPNFILWFDENVSKFRLLKKKREIYALLSNYSLFYSVLIYSFIAFQQISFSIFSFFAKKRKNK